MIETLPCALTQDTIETLIERHCRSTGQDRRTEVRKFLRLTLTATLLTMPRLPQIQIITDDLSASGVGFTSYWAFSEGELFVVPMRLADYVEVLALGRITSCVPTKGGVYRSGAKFIDSITTDSQIEIPEKWVQMGIEHR